jgi:hypothetical protein
MKENICLKKLNILLLQFSALTVMLNSLLPHTPLPPKKMFLRAKKYFSFARKKHNPSA